MENRNSNIEDWTKIYWKRQHPNELSVGEPSVWCEEKFGKVWNLSNKFGTWAIMWRGFEVGYEFSFKHEEDAALFVLAWK